MKISVTESGVQTVESPSRGEEISIYAKGSGKITPFGSFISNPTEDDVFGLGDEVTLTGDTDVLVATADNKFPYLTFVSTMTPPGEASTLIYPDTSPLSNIHPADSEGQDGTNWEWLPGALEFGGVTFDNLDPPPAMGYPITFLLKAPGDGEYFYIADDTEFTVYYHHSEGEKVRFLLGNGTIDKSLVTSANVYFNNYDTWVGFEVPATLLHMGGAGAPGDSAEIYVNAYGISDD